MSNLPGAGGRIWPASVTGADGNVRREHQMGVCPECGAANALCYDQIREFTTSAGLPDWERSWSCAHCKARGREHLLVEINYQDVHVHADKFEQPDQ